jgi:hypothetical protein
MAAPRTPGTAPFGGSPEGAATAAIGDDSDSSQDGNLDDGEANIAPDGFCEDLFFDSGGESDGNLEAPAAIEVPGAAPCRLLPWVRETLVPWLGHQARRGVALPDEAPNIPPFTAYMAPIVRYGRRPLEYFFMFWNLFIINNFIILQRIIFPAYTGKMAL